VAISSKTFLFLQSYTLNVCSFVPYFLACVGNVADGADGMMVRSFVKGT
jgi:hypothetical protein